MCTRRADGGHGVGIFIQLIIAREFQAIRILL